MRRFRMSLLLALAASALAVAPAIAGGWATVTVDQGSISGWQPGEPQQVEVTLMQHGVTPVNDGSVRFTLTNEASGETTTVSARRTGAMGAGQRPSPCRRAGTGRSSSAIRASRPRRPARSHRGRRRHSGRAGGDRRHEHRQLGARAAARRRARSGGDGGRRGHPGRTSGA